MMHVLTDTVCRKASAREEGIG